MRHHLIKNTIAMAIIAVTTSCCSSKSDNPFFSDYDTPYGIAPFDKIETAHYMPAFIEGIQEQNKEYDAIINNSETPTFENTIEAIEQSGEILQKVSEVFFNLTAAETNDELQKIAEEVSPLLSEHSDNFLLNEKMFARIEKIKQNSKGLTDEQSRLLNNYYNSFVRAGAKLNSEQKQTLRQINKDLTLLSLQFGANKLKEYNQYQLIVNGINQLEGLPQSVIEAAAIAAKEAHVDGEYLFTLQSPSRIPFLQYASNRDLREQLYKAYINIGNNNDSLDNKLYIEKMVNLRIQKANLLGYNNYAEFVLENTMAKTDQTVVDFLTNISQAAIQKATQEAADLQKLIQRDGQSFQLEAWDWPYYTEKLRAEKYNFSDEEVAPYFSLEQVRDGAFMVANRLYGITFKPVSGLSLYHPDVEAYEVKDADGSLVGLFLTDYFPRPGKSSGAWMSNYRNASNIGGKSIRPIVVNVCNFTKPTAATPSLLTLDEVETLFHEFGHALHGLLANTTYPSASGTSTKRDFVELPSQVMENWAFHPEILPIYAQHWKTKEPIPTMLIDKINQSATFNQGFMTTELVAAALLDMAWHQRSSTENNIDIKKFERESMQQIGLIPQVDPRYASTYFSHIFDGGYSAGYYSYLWAEVLDTDAFSLFLEKGILNPEVGMSFRRNILEKGDSEDPMDLYLKFRGQQPNPEALLTKRGLKEAPRK